MNKKSERSSNQMEHKAGENTIKKKNLIHQTTYIVFILKQKCKCLVTTERDLPLSWKKKVYECELCMYMNI